MKKAFLVILLFCTQQLFSQNNVSRELFSGHLKTANNVPVPNASILLKGTLKGSTSDNNGFFKLWVSKGDSITVSSIGFYDTTVAFQSSASIDIILKAQSKKLENILVKSNSRAGNSKELTQTDKEIISNGLQDFKTSQNLSYEPTPSSGLTFNSNGRLEAFHSLNSQPTGRLYTGSAIPTFTTKDDTKGSRYLFKDWVPGSFTNVNGDVQQNKTYQFNYDKMERNVLVTQNRQIVIELDKKEMKEFSFIEGEINYKFERVPEIDSQLFFQVLVKSTDKYSLYKKIETRFIKSNYVNTGLTESGHNYDEYLDEPLYYLFSAKTKQAIIIELRKKAIKKAFLDEKVKVDAYFYKNSDADIDEIFLKGLINNLNAQ